MPPGPPPEGSELERTTRAKMAEARAWFERRRRAALPLSRKERGALVRWIWCRRDRRRIGRPAIAQLASPMVAAGINGMVDGSELGRRFAAWTGEWIQPSTALMVLGMLRSRRRLERHCTSFEVPSASGVERFAAGDRILWRDAFGIGGIVIAASILGAAVVQGDPCAVALNVEPSEVVRAVGEWVQEVISLEGRPGAVSPSGIAGGRVIVTGEAFRRGVYDGKIRRAATDEEGRAKDAQELGAWPDWWQSRREDLDRRMKER